MIGSIVLITLWLFLAVGSWRLIVPILLTLVLGLTLTLLFAAVAVGTLNLVSVGFGILFVGLAVDFAIQFCVRYREMYSRTPSTAAAMAETGRRAGGQILVAAAATAAGFLSFVPTDFRGVAQLGLIAGGGMLIAFACTLTFLPSAIGAFRPPHAEGEVGFGWAAPLDDIVRRRRRALLLLFGGLAALGVALCRCSPSTAIRCTPRTQRRRRCGPLRISASRRSPARSAPTSWSPMPPQPRHWRRGCASCRWSTACSRSIPWCRATRRKSWR